MVTGCQPSRKSLIGFVVPTYRIDNHIHFVFVSFCSFFPQYLQLYHYNAHAIHFVLLSKIGGMRANQVNYGKAVRELIILSYKIF